MTNKYHAKNTWSELCQRIFDSMAEAKRGEELALLERAGEIEGLQYQVKFVLCDKPKISITIDFKYYENTHRQIVKGKDVYSNIAVYEDTKGVLMRDFRVKLAWMKEKYGISVVLTK